MTHGVGLYIAIVVLANIAATLWLIWWTARGSSKSVSEETTQHVWDGDLMEYNNPLPRWWLWLFIITIVYGFGYLVYYPGLGAFRGIKQWSMESQYQADEATARSALEQRFAALKDKSLDALTHDAGAMATGKNLFALNCSTCHGSDARGARGFPNLTDDDWLWGGSEQAIVDSIENGRNGTMPAWGSVLGREGVEQTAAYVLSLSGHQAPPDWVAAGKAKFETICSACHGMDGKGNAALGAPNLTDNIWLHGGSLAAIRETITNGRSSHMPAHAQLLGDTKIKLLAAYVRSLSKPIASKAVLATTPPGSLATAEHAP